ncbi:type II and III secretion system protein family protein [Prosthecomicrobium sp. N25]|uniref:type II and III secretion system protein family protein n=1 Tax=Prosthecomicrobium sp. N25 TaxID=3129254 RepID=UPI00307809EF
MAAAVAAGLAWGTVGAAGPAEAQERIVRVASGRPEHIRVSQGKSETLRVENPFADLVVGDPEIADVVPLTDKSFYVLGRAIGTTNVSVYDSRKQLLGIVDIEVSHDTGRLESEIQRRLPSSNIRVSTYNGKIMLSGTVRDAVSADKAMLIAKQFGPDVINSLSVGGSQQVMLEVRFVEANRNAGREIGINWGLGSSRISRNLGSGGATSGTYPPNANVGGAFTGTPGLLSGDNPFGVAVAQILGDGIRADLLIRALEEQGIGRRLAEPNLVALSGDTASFLAGGEYPIPVNNKDNQVTIEYKKFGVGLAFTPTVLENGLINLKIVPEVSELDYSNPLTLSGTTIPSLIVRRADTTIELRDGQSFAIAGLLQANSSNMLQQLPWLGSVPVLGALFRSTNYQKSETELVIIVTPRLVRPVVPGQALRTPLDNLRAPNDPELFLLGKTEVRKDKVQPPLPTPAEGLSGHILDMPNGGNRVAKR